MNKMGILVVGLLIGAIFAAGGVYYYMDIQVNEAFQEGMQYQQSLTPTAVTPASVSMSLTSGTFNHSATVDSDGGVDTETDVTDTLTISNDDETRTANDCVLLLYNPVTGTDGLPDNLETSATEVSVTIQGVTKKLFHDGDYTSGAVIGDLAPGDEASYTITFTLEEAVDGTFQDGQTYDCNLYLYQPDANYAIPVSFTVST